MSNSNEWSDAPEQSGAFDVFNSGAPGPPSSARSIDRLFQERRRARKSTRTFSSGGLWSVSTSCFTSASSARTG
jgi:hypothetical protein